MSGAPDEAHILRQVQDALVASEVARAIAIARDALAGGVVHPMLLNLRAYWLEQQGNDSEALADLAQAAKLAPGDPLISNAYGLQLAKMNKREESIAAFRKAITLDANFAPAHFNLGWATEPLGDLDTSRRCYERAIALQPDFARALSHLANLAARRGDWEQANSYADRALTLDPHQYLAMRAKAIAAVAQGDFEIAEQFVQRIAAEPQIPIVDRAIADSVLGDLRHAQGRYPEAFAAYEEGNRRQREFHAPRFATEGPDSASGYTEWLAAQFETGQAADWAVRTDTSSTAESGGTAGHAFLVSFPRSGTTLLENILASHPKVVALEEKDLFADAVREFMAVRKPGDALKTMHAADIARHRDIYWRNAQSFGVDVRGKLFIDKHPLTSTKLPLVAKLFPRAKILFALRDPRDVVLSCFRRAFQMNASTYTFLSLTDTAHYYGAVMRLSALYRAKLGLEWRDVRHETLLDDFAGETRNICAFLGLDWSPEMTQFAERDRARMVATASAAQVRQGLNREGVGQWRNYKDQMAAVLPILNPWAEKFGYPAD